MVVKANNLTVKISVKPCGCCGFDLGILVSNCIRRQMPNHGDSELVETYHNDEPYHERTAKLIYFDLD
jgi:hypothetical protein